MANQTGTLHMMRPEGNTFGGLVRNVILLVLLVLLVPLGVIVLGAPIALLVRAVIEAAQRIAS